MVGLVNGLLVEKLSIPAFIATLATQMFVRGLVQMFCDQTTYKVASIPFPVLALGRLTFSNIVPLPLILFIIATLIAAYVLNRRFIGRSMYIVGGNLEAANMMGCQRTEDPDYCPCYLQRADMYRRYDLYLPCRRSLSAGRNWL